MGAGHSSWGLDDIHFDKTGNPMTQAIHIRPAHGQRDYKIISKRHQGWDHYPNYDMQYYHHHPNHHNYYPHHHHHSHKHRSKHSHWDHHHHDKRHWSYHPHWDVHHHDHRDTHHHWYNYRYRGGKDYPGDGRRGDWHPTCGTNWHLPGGRYWGRGDDWRSPDRGPDWRHKPHLIRPDPPYDVLKNLGDDYVGRRFGFRGSDT